MEQTESFDIAVIGMSGRFPKSPDLDAFWELLKNGEEAIAFFSDDELLKSGVDADLLQNTDYVKAGTVIPNAEFFDASFFNMNTLDAQISDPQQRLFMECAWEALEQAGYSPGSTAARIGLYAGVSNNTYSKFYIEPNKELVSMVGTYRLFTLSGKDFIATRTAYKLNLKGPAVSVQTACSTSLVAVHQACQSLLNYESDLVLAGGASIFFPQKTGYLYQEGMILSPDGHCRTFDAKAKGTVPGQGVGIVLLKRLDEALEDGDTIHAVIKGSAINNDGADKIAYTAPSVNGQANVIEEAQTIANVHPDEISYIEAHGTATLLGDPIEIEALTMAFRRQTQKKQYCAIGSVKSNIGHADTAAGIAGLLKTILAIKHRKLPPSLHFQKPNPEIDFENSPFFVNTKLTEWNTPDNSPLIAGVSSFGIGGTNAHVIVAEAPVNQKESPSADWQLITLSAKTPAALKNIQENLALYIERNPEISVADTAYTLNAGRDAFDYRTCITARNTQELLHKLRSEQKTAPQRITGKNQSVCFLFPGQGSQYPNMSSDLYRNETIFKETFDKCAQILLPILKTDIRSLIYNHAGENADLLNQTQYTQPALFAVEYALAQQWMHRGVKPSYMIGHSIGEFVAACIAGVFTLEESLWLVSERGRLIQSLPQGAMLGVIASEKELLPYLSEKLSLSAVNSAKVCVAGGLKEDVEDLKERLRAKGIATKVLNTSHAFHSYMMEPILEDFRKTVLKTSPKAPVLPYLSNLSGTWITAEEATDAMHWVKHLRNTVRFSDTLETLFNQTDSLLLEVGPGNTLITLAKQHSACPTDIGLFQSLPRPNEKSQTGEYPHFTDTLGKLWTHGVQLNRSAFYHNRKGRRIPLPTYPFERKLYSIKKEDSADKEQKTPVVVSQPKHDTSALLISGNEVERELTRLFGRFLGLAYADIGAKSDFFDLGGDSLLGVQLIQHINQKFQLQLDTHTLLQNSTVSELTQLIKHHQKNNNHTMDASELIIEIQKGNPMYRPLVLMHPVGGHVYFYRELARHIGSETPVWGIRAIGAEGECEPLTTVSEMATAYTEILRQKQPTGPYYLAGSSFGGTLAYAMAQELTAKGEKVNFVGLIDTPSTAHMPQELSETAEILFYMLKVGEKQDVSLSTLNAMTQEEQLDFFISSTQKEGVPSLTKEQLKTMLLLFKTNMRAMTEYSPPSYPGKLYFFLAAERDVFNAQTPANGWFQLAEQGIEIYTIPGNHISINQEPNVQILAKHLYKCLTESRPNPLLALSKLDIDVMAGLYKISQIIFTIHDLGIPEYLEQNPYASVAELTDFTSVSKPDILESIMKIGTDFHLFEKSDEEKYTLTRKGKKLCLSNEQSVVPWLIFAKMSYLPWSNLTESIKIGQQAFEQAYGMPIYDYLREHPEQNTAFNRYMEQTTHTWLSKLPSAYPFQGRVVDVGGNKGSLMAKLLQQRPDLQATVFDLEQATENAESIIADAGVADRCKIVSGSFFDEAAIPRDGNIYLFSRVLFNWNDEKVVEILKNCNAAMPKHAKLLILDGILTSSGAGMLLNHLNLYLLFDSKHRTKEQYEELVLKAGFKNLSWIFLDGIFHLLEAVPE